jgi:hypothetical protein
MPRLAAVAAIAVLALALLVAVVTRAASPARRPSGARLGQAPAAGRPAAKRTPLRPAALIRAYFGTGWLGACMIRIAWRESRLRPHATNWTDHHSDGSVGSFGLFQIGAVHRAAGEPVSRFRLRMLDPRANVRMARRLYLSGGLSPWGGSC